MINGFIKTSTFVYGTTRTTLPPTPLAGRTFIRLKVNTNTLYIGGDTVTSSGATQGLAVATGTFMEFNIDEDTPIYGICASGQTASVSILEAY